MADVRGIIALGDIPKKVAPIFEVNVELAASIATISITNSSGSPRLINVYLSKGTTLKRIFPKDKLLRANAVAIDTTPYLLGRGDKIQAESDADGVEFVITGTTHTE